jgi:hypothetical protein
MLFGDTTFLPATFWAKVRCDADSHWRWTGMLDKDGYGHSFSCQPLGKQRVHRLMYMAATSTMLPQGKLAILWQVDHICKVRNCVNPEHLQLLSQRDHYEKDVLAAILRKARFCRKGHERDVHGTNAKGVCNQCAKDRRAMKKFREHIFKDTWGT